MDKTAISERWKRIAAQNDTKIVAIVRQKGKVLKFLNEDAWNSFCANFGVADDLILSVHCYIKSNNRTIYRNKYEVKDKTGRFITSTLSYSYKLDDDDSESVYIYHEDVADMHECRASSLKSIMDLATNTVVRYIEAILHVKVISISIDYAIDAKSQLWMLWSSDVKCISIDQFQSQAIPGVSGGDRTGRMLWAGPKYFEADPEDRDAQHRKSPKRLRSSTSRDQNKADSQSASYQLHFAETVLDDKAKTGGSVKSARKNQGSSNDLDSPRRIFTAIPECDTSNKYPDPFKCHGDYCSIHTTLMGKLRYDQAAISHTMDKLFSENEMKILRGNKHYNRMLELATSTPNLASIQMKSIILARQERRNLKTDGDCNESNDWRSYPITPRQLQPSIGSRMVTDVVEPDKNTEEVI